MPTSSAPAPASRPVVVWAADHTSAAFQRQRLTIVMSSRWPEDVRFRLLCGKKIVARAATIARLQRTAELEFHNVRGRFIII